MKPVNVPAVLLAGGSLLFGGVAFLPAAEKPAAAPVVSSPIPPNAPEFPVKLPTFGEPDVAGWTRVNEKTRHRMAERLAIRCRTWTETEMRGVHGDKFVEVFVNDAGKPAITSIPFTDRNTPAGPAPVRFPIGSVIIKVKYAAAKGGEPLLRTAMIKREAGYNASCGDWEFVATSGDGQQIAEHGQIARCMECHKNNPSTDFTFIDDYRPRPAKPAK